MSENEYGLTVEGIRAAVKQLNSRDRLLFRGGYPEGWFVDVLVGDHGWHRFTGSGKTYSLTLIHDELTIVELEDADAEVIRIAAQKIFEEDGSQNATVLKGAICPQ